VVLIVPLLLLGVAIVLMAASYFRGLRRARRDKALADEAPLARILIHSINGDRCTGCDACVVVCPTDVLELVDNKSKVVRFGDCIQCEQCMWACPTQALVMHWEDTDPPPLKVPELDPFYQTRVEGMFLIGEVAGKGLVKNAANAGRAVVERLVQTGLAPSGRRGRSTSGGEVDVAIVGSGPGGLAAALSCIHHGLSYVVLEKEQVIASTIARYPKGKDVMAEPYTIRNVSLLPMYDSSKEELLGLWQEVIRQTGMEVRMGEAVETVKRDGAGLFEVRTTVAAYRARRAIVATGTRGKPRTLGVPGENLPKVCSLLEDPALYRGQDVLVVGGGDSAVEAAMALADAGARVALSYRGKSFARAAAKNKQRIGEYAKDNKVLVLFGSQVVCLEEDSVTINLGDQDKRLPNRAAFVLIGADPPVAWLEKLGVTYGERPHWYALGATDQLVESLVGRQDEAPTRADECAAIVTGKKGAVLAPAPAPELRPAVPEPTLIRPMPIRPVERPAALPGFYGDGAVAVTLPGAGARPHLPGVHEKPDRKKRREPTREPSKAQPMSLEEFARSHQVRPRKPRPRGGDVTRLLRSLHDEGARLADEDTGLSHLSELEPRAGLSMATVEANIAAVAQAAGFKDAVVAPAASRQ